MPTQPGENTPTEQTDSERGLLREDHSEIRLVPAAVREMWTRGSGSFDKRELDAWRAFLKTHEGRRWLHERAEAHRR